MNWGRGYFVVQAVAGAAWWVGVFASPWVRETTLGGLDPVAVAAADIPLFVIASAVAAGGVRTAGVVATGWTLLVAVAMAAYATFSGQAGWGAVLMVGAAGGSLCALSLMLWGRIPTGWIVRGPFAPRVAVARATRGRHVALTFAQMVVFWGFFLALVLLVIFPLEQRWGVGLTLPWPTVVIGICALVLGSALGIWSAATMSILGDGTPLPSATANRLVISGPYRWLRNPMALAGVGQIVGMGLLLGSWFVIVFGLAGSLIWNYAVRPHEEADLEARFGADFVAYRANVRCWIPRRPVRSPNP